VVKQAAVVDAAVDAVRPLHCDLAGVPGEVGFGRAMAMSAGTTTAWSMQGAVSMTSLAKMLVKRCKAPSMCSHYLCLQAPCAA
jgi:hypothetical protein